MIIVYDKFKVCQEDGSAILLADFIFVVRNDDCIRETEKERFFHCLKKGTRLTVLFSIRLDHIFATRKKQILCNFLEWVGGTLKRQLA
jgi:hypothetical protein